MIRPAVVNRLAPNTASTACPGRTGGVEYPPPTGGMVRDAPEPRIVNADDGDRSGTDTDGGRWKRLGRLAGSTRLGCTLEEIQPGGRPADYHYHLANEEAMYVLEGAGTLRTPRGE